MTDSAPTEPFAPALGHLRAGDPTRAAELFAELAAAHPSRSEGPRLLELACLAQQGAWDAIIERTADLPGDLQLQLTLAFRGAALAQRGRFAEGLKATEQARHLPRRPHLPDPVGLLLSPCWDIIDTMDLATMTAGLAHVQDAAPILETLQTMTTTPPPPATGDHKARDEQLLRATRVVLRRGDTERVVRAEQGIYLTIHDPTSDRSTVRLFEGPALGPLLRCVVNDYLDRGFDVTDWTLVDSPEELETALLDAQSRGDHNAALRAGRELVIRAPEDARLAALGLAAAVAHRGYAPCVALSQRSLALAEEPDWALRQHAAVLHGAGHRLQCLGALLYLREHYGPESMTPDAWALLATCFVGPLHRPGIAEELITAGLSAHPGNIPLLLLGARAKIDADIYAGALEILAPLLAGPNPPAEAFVLALQAHLEGGLEGTEALAHRAVKHHAQYGLLKALSLEVADRPGPSLKEYRTLIEGADGPAMELDLRLHAMRAALRVGAYEDALRLAREAQTEIGEPDPRCLSVMYDSLRALEPSEDREDLAEMVATSRREAADTTLSRDMALRAMLSAGIYLDPAALEPLWGELAPAACSDEDRLRSQTPLLGEGLVCVATRSGFAALFDEVGLASRLSGDAWDWFKDAKVLTAQREAGRVAVAAGDTTVLWVRVTTAPLNPVDAPRFARLVPQALTVTSGRVFVGPGEALHGGTTAPKDHATAQALAQELGGRSFYLAPGRYRVTVYQRTVNPWPIEDVRTDPCDVIFHLQKG